MKPTISLRLQQTKATTHPIQVSIGFGIKYRGKYLQLYKSTGISLPRNHWDDVKNLPIDSVLRTTMLDLINYIGDRLTDYYRLSDEQIVEFFNNKAFHSIIEDGIDISIHKQPTKFQKDVDEAINKELPRGFFYEQLKNKIIRHNFRLVDSNNRTINLDRFFVLHDAPLEYILEPTFAITATSEHLSEPGAIQDNSSLFADYILEVAKAKMQLPGKGRLKDDTPYVNLSKKFKKWNSKITINQYNDNVSKEFLNWLRPQMNTLNNFAKYVSRLKSVLYWAIDEDKCISPTAVRPSSKTYSAEREEVRQPYLTEEQLESMMQIKFGDSWTEKQLEYVRDLFLVGAYTGGLRFGDWNQAFRVQTKQHKGHTIHFIESRSTKVGERKQIPLHDKVYKILEKYNFQFKELDLDKYNILIQDVMPRVVSIDESFNQDFISYRINLQTGKSELYKEQQKGWPEPRVPKLFECISSHVARRSFCTNFYYHRKIQAEICMLFSGHAKLDDFLSYVQTTVETKGDDFIEQVILADRQKG
ncbi:MAG TPA: phage integrase SAM-like domain-containing protein [Bacteroidia bacterium]|nr:phage integrase SAM-like domain-containing protein [Bacteroidia bacterium]